MKKISMILAILMLCGALFSCGDTDEKQTEADTTKNTVQATEKETEKVTEAKKDEETTKAPETESKPAETEAPEPELLPDSRFTLDGKLDEWGELLKIELIGTGNTSNKHVTFYGAAADDGIYLACDSYHDMYSHGVSDWWLNSNFEFFIPKGFDSNEQYFVYADGIGAQCKTSENVTKAAMLTEELKDQPTKYHTVTEVFIAYENVPTGGISRNTVAIGVAWKTAGEYLIGGAAHAQPDGGDDWWVPVNTWPHNGDLVVTPNGLCFPVDYFN